MICVDGFILTHAFERVDLPTAAQVDAFLPAFEPRQVVDPESPMTIGAMVGPEAFAEVRYLAHKKQLLALELIPRLARAFEDCFGRRSGGLVRPYRIEEADTVVVAMGSVTGTLEEVVDEMNAGRPGVGVLDICSFRPFPLAAVRDALDRARHVIVVEKNLAVGMGGVLASHVRMALRGKDATVSTVIAGLGGRAITRSSLRTMIAAARRGELEEVHFLDLNWDVVERELERMGAQRRSGPTAENIVRDLGGLRRAP
jgi:pyruvate ferredoxin oxidoreductase alpha subunit